MSARLSARSLLIASAAVVSIAACSSDSGGPLLPSTGLDSGVDGQGLVDAGLTDGGDDGVGAEDTAVADSEQTDGTGATDVDSDTGGNSDTTNDSGSDAGAEDTGAPDVGAECEAPDPSTDCSQCACVSGDWQCDDINEGMVCDAGLLCAETVCASGVCAELGPLDCQDGFSCTIDSCSEDGGCTNELAPDACIISGACVAAGDTASRACGVCDPTTSPTDWTPYEGCTYSTSFPVSDGSFGVSQDGRVTLAGWNRGALTAFCLDAYGDEQGSVELFAEDDSRSASGGYAYVGRAAETGQSVVLAHLPSTEGDDRFTTLMAWWLDADCRLVTGPTLLPGMDGTESSGSIEYADLAMGAQGQTAIVYQSRLEGSYNPTVALYDGVGEPTRDAQSLAISDCSDRTYGVHIAMNESTGGFIASCQGHASDPIMVRRYDAAGAIVDVVPFDATGEHGSSWYDSHAIGMSDDGSFVLVFAESGTSSLKAAFYDPSGDLITTETVVTGEGSWHDGFRRSHAHIAVLADGSYLIPGGKRNEIEQMFAVYTTSGNMVVEVPLSTAPPGLRVDGSGAIYAFERAGTLTRGLGPYATELPLAGEE